MPTTGLPSHWLANAKKPEGARQGLRPDNFREPVAVFYGYIASRVRQGLERDPTTVFADATGIRLKRGEVSGRGWKRPVERDLSAQSTRRLHCDWMRERYIFSMSTHHGGTEADAVVTEKSEEEISSLEKRDAPLKGTYKGLVKGIACAGVLAWTILWLLLTLLSLLIGLFVLIPEKGNSIETDLLGLAWPIFFVAIAGAIFSLGGGWLAVRLTNREGGVKIFHRIAFIAIIALLIAGLAGLLWTFRLNQSCGEAIREAWNSCTLP